MLNCDVTKKGGELLYGSIAFNDSLKTMHIDQEAIPEEYDGMDMDKVRMFSTAIEHGYLQYSRV